MSKEARSDDPKSFDEIIRRQIATGLKESKRDWKGLFLSAFTAGLEVGFSVLFMAVLFTLYHSQVSESSLHVIISAAYSIGFIFVIIGRSELFTEHTVLSVLPVLNKQTSVVELLKTWGIIYAGNLIGGWLFSLIVSKVGIELHFVSTASFETLALKMTDYSWSIILYSGIIAGWLMGMLSWLLSSAKETISRLFLIFLVTFSIGLGGFHHCIVGSIEVFSGFITSDSISLLDYLSFLSAATLGNIVGGGFFVAVLKYSSHTIKD